MSQQTFHFHGPNTVTINQNTQPIIEPCTETLSFKTGASVKQEWLEDAKAAGYSNFSIYLRDMVSIGKALRPFLNHTIHDILKQGKGG